MIETRLIKLCPKELLQILFLQYGLPWLWGLLGGIAVFVGIGIFLNAKFYILALMWIFLILPMLVAYLYFYYGLQPLTALNTIPHKVVFQPDSIRINLINEDKETEGERVQVRKEFAVLYVEFKEIKAGRDYIILNFCKKGLLCLPVLGFDNNKDFLEIISRFSDEYSERLRLHP